MPDFKFKGKNKVGNIVEGVRSGKNSAEVRAQLEKEQIQVLNVQRKSIEINIPGFGKKKAKVKLRELSVFNRQLSVMFNAGLPITQGIGILASQQKNLGFANSLNEIKKEVEAGANLSNSMKKHPKIFNELYTSLIQAGEASGNLDTILLRLSSYIENITKLTGKVKSALAYPISVLVIGIVLTGVILTKVVPVFQRMFEGMGAKLPAPTQMVVDASKLLQNHFFKIVLGFVGLIFAFKSYNATFKGRRVVDKIKLKTPVFGDLLLKVGVARVTRTLATLLNSGVEIIEAITITSKTAGNAIIEDAVLRSRTAVQEGRPLWEAWEVAKVFPFMVTQMVSVGEQTGSLSTMLEKIADFYDDEVDAAVSALISLMEPIMIVFLGGLVGSVIIAMYLPMFDIIGKV